jgi:hypothetical protein
VKFKNLNDARQEWDVFTGHVQVYEPLLEWVLKTYYYKTFIIIIH